jgi:hypothetical protein
MYPAAIGANAGLLEGCGKVANVASLAAADNVWLPIGAVLSVCHEWQSGVPVGKRQCQGMGLLHP